jgi:hypothetical protein
MSKPDLERQARLNELTEGSKHDTRTCPKLRRANNRFELNKNCNHQKTHQLSDGKPVKSIEAWGDCCDELDRLDGKTPRSTLKTRRAPKVADTPTPNPATKPTPVKSKWKGWGKQPTQTQKNEERFKTIKRMIEAPEGEEEEMVARRLAQPAPAPPTVLRQETPKPPVMPLEGLQLVQDPIQRRLYKNKHNIEHDDFDLGKLPDGTHIVSDNINKKVYKAGKKNKSKGKSRKAKGKSHKRNGKSHKAKGKSRKAKGKSHKTKGKRKTRKH